MEKYSTEGPIRWGRRIEKSPFLIKQIRSGARGRAFQVLQDLDITQTIPKDSKVLYVGAGGGHVSQLLAEISGADVTVVDLDDLRTSDAKTLPFVQADATDLPFKDSSFDIIAFVDMLHHAVEQDQILDEAHRVLVKHGKLLIHEETIPSLKSIRSRNFIKKMISIVDDIVNFQPPGVNPYNFRSVEEWIDFGQTHDFKLTTLKSHKWGLYDFLPNIVKPPYEDKRSLGRFFETTGFVFEKD